MQPAFEPISDIRDSELLGKDRVRTLTGTFNGGEERTEERRGAEWRGGGQTDRQAGGAIIAGFMYELLIESVVTS